MNPGDEILMTTPPGRMFFVLRQADEKVKLMLVHESNDVMCEFYAGMTRKELRECLGIKSSSKPSIIR